VPDGSPERAVSEVLGYIFVFSLILLTISVVSVGGYSVLEDARDNEQNSNAERALDVLANNIADLYARGAPSRATEISLEESQLFVGDPITFEVSVDDGISTTSVQREIDPIVFRGAANTDFVYEAGAVFREQQDGGVTLRNPPLSVNSERMVFALVRTNSSNQLSLSGSTILVRTRATTREVAVRSTGTAHDVTFTVTDSPRQSTWRQYFQREHGMSCTESGNTLQCTAANVDRVLVSVYNVRVNLEE
jgi:hypothetical protein